MAGFAMPGMQGPTIETFVEAEQCISLLRIHTVGKTQHAINCS